MKNSIIKYILFFNILFSQNDFPIVLIHGFMGWGPGEMGDYNYWGGNDDYVELFKSEGFNIIEVSVGPVSSNWERAIEVYYQLKGGQVDYGKFHSNQHGIIQKPKNKYISKPLYPNWDKNNPVHLVGHSMGGQTARMLQFLIENPIYQDAKNKVLEQSTLLAGKELGMIKSITSISTPHDGTTLAGIVTKIVPFIQYFIGIAGLIDGNGFYDFDLEQWGFYRNDDERWPTYLNRLRQHNAFKTKNISSWDLSLQGAKKLNDFLIASPDIYYFSLVTSITKPKFNSNYHVPQKSASILTRSRSRLMGSRPGYWGDGSSTDSSWYENDGVVNTVSMYGPTTGENGGDPMIKYDKNDILIPGQWYWKKINDIDHWNITGHMCDKKKGKISIDYFREQFKILKALPPL